MPGTYTKQLAAPGTTGNNTHATTEDVDAERVAVQLLVEAVGATPTVTWIVEGSMDGTNWYAMAYIDAASDTAAFTATTVTAVGAYLKFLWCAAGEARFFRRYRVRTTANTNITYSVLFTFQERGE